MRFLKSVKRILTSEYIREMMKGKREQYRLAMGIGYGRDAGIFSWPFWGPGYARRYIEEKKQAGLLVIVSSVRPFRL
ncbi:MAG: hypothetical protein H6540_06585 [Bacteroidales bacterium]|nr:hypothetical protein [Bacteroidales bacterium]